jgi:hypothetical protein
VQVDPLVREVSAPAILARHHARNIQPRRAHGKIEALKGVSLRAEQGHHPPARAEQPARPR